MGEYFPSMAGLFEMESPYHFNVSLMKRSHRSVGLRLPNQTGVKLLIALLYVDVDVSTHFFGFTTLKFAA